MIEDFKEGKGSKRRCAKSLRKIDFFEKPSLSLAFSRYLHAHYLHSRVVKNTWNEFFLVKRRRTMRVTIMAEREKSFAIEGCSVF